MLLLPYLYDRQIGFIRSAQSSITRPDLDCLLSRLVCGVNDAFISRGEDGIPVPPFTCKFRKDKESDLLAVANEDGEVYLIDTDKGRGVLKNFTAHNNAVFDVCWLPDRNSLLTGSGDFRCCLFDMATCKKVSTFRFHTASVKTVDVFREGHETKFAAGSKDGCISIWDIREDGLYSSPAIVINYAHERAMYSGNKKTNLSPSSVSAVAFKDAYTLVSAGVGDSVIRIWDLRKTYDHSHGSSRRKPRETISFTDSKVQGFGYTSLVFNSLYTKLYACSTANKIFEIDCHSYSKKYARFNGFKCSTYFIKMSLSYDDQYIVSGSSDNKAYIWKVSKPGLPIFELPGHTAEVTSVAFGAYDNTKVATCADDNKVLLWKTKYSEHTEDNPDTEQVAASCPYSSGMINDSSDSISVFLPVTPVNHPKRSPNFKSPPTSQNILSYFSPLPTTPVSQPQLRQGPNIQKIKSSKSQSGKSPSNPGSHSHSKKQSAKPTTSQNPSNPSSQNRLTKQSAKPQSSRSPSNHGSTKPLSSQSPSNPDSQSQSQSTKPLSSQIPSNPDSQSHPTTQSAKPQSSRSRSNPDSQGNSARARNDHSFSDPYESEYLCPPKYSKFPGNDKAGNVLGLWPPVRSNLSLIKKFTNPEAVHSPSGEISPVSASHFGHSPGNVARGSKEPQLSQSESESNGETTPVFPRQSRCNPNTELDVVYNVLLGDSPCKNSAEPPSSQSPVNKSPIAVTDLNSSYSAKTLSSAIPNSSIEESTHVPDSSKSFNGESSKPLSVQHVNHLNRDTHISSNPNSSNSPTSDSTNPHCNCSAINSNDESSHSCPIIFGHSSNNVSPTSLCTTSQCAMTPPCTTTSQCSHNDSIKSASVHHDTHAANGLNTEATKPQYSSPPVVQREPLSPRKNVQGSCTANGSGSRTPAVLKGSGSETQGVVKGSGSQTPVCVVGKENGRKSNGQTKRKLDVTDRACKKVKGKTRSGKIIDLTPRKNNLKDYFSVIQTPE